MEDFDRWSKDERFKFKVFVAAEIEADFVLGLACGIT